MTAHEETPILDLTTYVKRLFQQFLSALIPAVLVLVAGAVWTLTAPSSWEARSAVVAKIPTASTEADATQQGAMLAPMVASDLLVAENSFDVASRVIAKHPEIQPTQLKSMVKVRSAGLGLQFNATAGDAASAAALANDYAVAFTEVLNEQHATSQEALRFTYRQSVVADPKLAAVQSGKLPRVVITVGLAGLTWVAAAVLLDLRAQRRSRRQSS
ncbi:hypothetical protein EII34_08900 [Arachnia propionica]|uniref:Uncharacterized protein n=1 Tax=Arachnia propionica TaxID=1750 RepID=A0A3P1T628_9ACTN|nr:hypothetical protein [Arachnia propionica]MDO5083884.1 hypothetical protein [Arachnia propionica]RRD04655.1 hypothetical protein EII34_08900 [Arachnia propionica]